MDAKTTKRLLLVAAAPGLAEDPDTDELARTCLAATLDLLAEGSTVLTGGEPGHENWLRSECERRHLHLCEYRRDGFRWFDGSPTGRAELLDRPLPERLVAAAQRATEAGWQVACVVLVDGDAATAAAQLTRVARAAGLATTEHAYPSEDLPSRTPVVWLDLETTGLRAGAHSVIEIGGVLCSHNSRRVAGTFEARIRVERWMLVEPRAMQVNGYSEPRWRDAVPAERAWRDLLAWLPPRWTLAGQNCPFDRGFVRAELERLALPEPGWLQHALDTKPLIERLLRKTGRTPNAKLDTACAHFGIPNANAHRALADAHRARLVYLALLGEDYRGHMAEVTT